MQTASQPIYQSNHSNIGMAPPVLRLPSNLRIKVYHESKTEQHTTEHLGMISGYLKKYSEIMYLGESQSLPRYTYVVQQKFLLAKHHKEFV